MNDLLHSVHADPWAEDFVDVATLNGQITGEIVARIDAARREELAAPTGASTSLLLLGSAGSGKTHLFARLRRRCAQRATFALIRPDMGVTPTARAVLDRTFEALSHRASGLELTQLELLVGAVFASLDGMSRYPAVALDGLRALPAEARAQQIETVLDLVERHHPSASLDWLQRLLGVPFLAGPERRATTTWLRGSEPSEPQLNRLGLTAPLADHEVLPALRTLCLAAGLRTPLVVVFDQLENLYDAEAQAGRIEGYGNLICDLFDGVRGVVIVQMVLDGEWERRILPRLSTSQRSRVAGTTLTLDLPRPTELEELVRAWVGQLPAEAREPFPVPEARLVRWRQTPGLTPRMLKCELAAYLEAPTSDPSGPQDSAEPVTPEAGVEWLQLLWDDYLAQTREHVIESRAQGEHPSEERLLGGLVALGRVLVGWRAVARKGPLGATVEFERGGQSLLVVACQTANGSSFNAQLLRILGETVTRRVLAVRDSGRAVPPTWVQGQRRINELQQSALGRWFELEPEQLCQLLALHDLLADAGSGDLTDQAGRAYRASEVELWAREHLAAQEWPLPAELEATMSRPPRVGEGQGSSRVDPPTTEDAGTQQAADKAAAVSSTAGEPALAIEVLRRLQFASLERVVREVQGRRPGTSAAAVHAELKAAGADILWLSPSLLSLAEVAQ
jgi:hypothetical protein